jgi:hypothetical protein
MAEIHFQPMEASNIESDVSIQFLVGGLVIHFAGIFHLSCSVKKLFKNLMLMQQLRVFSIFGGIYDLKFLLQTSRPRKALPSENLRGLRHYGPGGCYSRSSCRGPEE